jgi:uncharacterized membrane protein (Fun14 family)
MTTTDDTTMRFLIALLGGPMIGWALGYFIRKSIKVIAFIGGMFFLSVLQKGVEDNVETAVNRTVDISNQAIADSGGDLSIPLFVAGFIVGLGLGLNNGRSKRSRLVIED